MKNATIVLVLLLMIFGVCLSFASKYKVEWECRAGVAFGRAGFHESVAGVFLGHSSVDLSGKAFSVKLRGANQFQFLFPENVTAVHLSLGSDLVYSGPAISTFDASSYSNQQPLTIKLQVTGSEYSVQISDKCSMRSFLASL